MRRQTPTPVNRQALRLRAVNISINRKPNFLILDVLNVGIFLAEQNQPQLPYSLLLS